MDMIAMMRCKQKNMVSIICLFLLLVACTSDISDGLLSKRPEVKLNELSDYYNQQLTGSEHGWKAFLYPAGGGGFTFYMKFSGEGRVTMVADVNDLSAKEPYESSFRIEALQRPSLFFDTYSYIHLLSDPDPEAIGGLPGAGLASDFEYAFTSSDVNSTSDTIRLQGNFNKTKILLVKATEEEAAEYSLGKLSSTMSSQKKYVTSHPYLFLLVNNEKVGVRVDTEKRKFSILYPQGDSLNVITSLYSYIPKGLFLKDTLRYATTNFRQTGYDAVTDKLYIRANGIRNDVKASSAPVFPLHLSLGSLFNSLSVPPDPDFEGWSPLFKKQWEDMAHGFYGCCDLGTSYMDFDFDKRSQKVDINIYVQRRGITYLARYPYLYTKTPEGVFTFSSAGPPDLNGEYLMQFVSPILKKITDHKFSMEYRLISATKTYAGRLRSLDDSKFYFTGNLK